MSWCRRLSSGLFGWLAPAARRPAHEAADAPQVAAPEAIDETRKEEMRRRRAERFAAAPQPPAVQPAVASAPPPPPPPATQSAARVVAAPVPEPQAGASESEPSDAAPLKRPRVAVEPAAASPARRSATAVAASASTQASPSPLPPPPPPESAPAAAAASEGKGGEDDERARFLVWQHQLIVQALQVTTQPEEARAKPALLLLSSEVREGSLLGIDELDLALLARLEHPPRNWTPFHFFVDVLKSLTKIPAAAGASDARREAVQTLRERVCAYVGISLLSSDMIEDRVRQLSLAELRQLLEADPVLGRSVPADLLPLMCKSLDDAGLREIFEPILRDILEQPREQVRLPLAVQQLQALAHLVRAKPLAAMVTASPRFLPPCVSGRQLENHSLLGPFLSLGVDVAHAAFNDAERRPLRVLDAALDELRRPLHKVQLLVADVLHGLVHVSPEARERVLEWLSAAAKLNADRRKMHIPDPLRVSSDEFALNLASVALSLAAPIVDAPEPRFERIDLRYCLGAAAGNDRVDLSGATRLNARPQDMEEQIRAAQQSGLLRSDSSDSSFNFATEIFFLAHELLRQGVVRAIGVFGAVAAQARELRMVIDSIPPEHPLHEFATSQHRQRLALLSRQLAHMRLYLTDRYMLEPLARFLNWTCLWLLHLSERGTQQHALVPEFIVESVVDVTGFVLGLQHTAEGVAALRQEGVLRFLITFMSGPHKVRNPHLKGRFPELLRLWLPSSIGPDSPPPSVEALAASALTSHPLARTRLLPALLELFVDIEYGERQFYEKFNTRYSIALLLQHLWLVPQHRRQFEACSRDKPFMLRFINVLLNDMIYLLDEGLRHVAEVGQNQRALANVQEWNALAVAEQEERREGFARTERIAGSLMALAGAVVHMVWYMTNEEDGGSIEPFVMPEVVDRMGQMVAFFVAQLVGPSVEALRIEHRERVNFHPRTLLTEILSIFLHLAGRDDFLRSVAADQRSFTPELFVSAAALARKRALLSERQLQVLEGRAARLRELANEVKEDDEKLGEIPERFLDPLLSALMRDPVILPHSKQRVERTSIVRHLLNDPCDPFTRQPMTADMLVPDLELKAEIETFIRERRAALAAAAAAPSSSSSSSSASSTSVSSSASAAAPRDPASGPPQ